MPRLLMGLSANQNTDLPLNLSRLCHRCQKYWNQMSSLNNLGL
jgi:hypothetical protein